MGTELPSTERGADAANITTEINMLEHDSVLLEVVPPQPNNSTQP